MVVGTVVAVGLTLVSPNVTYPKAVREASQKVLDGEAAKRSAIAEKLASLDAAVVKQGETDQAALDKAVKKANDDLAKVEGKEVSIMGLEKPMFELKNPGIVSIPLGFLAVLLGSLLFRDKRSEELWPEVYARQNTGILASKAASH
jgi:cation/acetate symporter